MEKKRVKVIRTIIITVVSTNRLHKRNLPDAQRTAGRWISKPDFLHLLPRMSYIRPRLCRLAMSLKDGTRRT